MRTKNPQFRVKTREGYVYGSGDANPGMFRAGPSSPGHPTPGAQAPMTDPRACVPSPYPAAPKATCRPSAPPAAASGDIPMRRPPPEPPLRPVGRSHEPGFAAGPGPRPRAGRAARPGDGHRPLDRIGHDGVTALPEGCAPGTASTGGRRHLQGAGGRGAGRGLRPPGSGRGLPRLLRQRRHRRRPRAAPPGASPAGCWCRRPPRERSSTGWRRRAPTCEVIPGDRQAAVDAAGRLRGRLPYASHIYQPPFLAGIATLGWEIAEALEADELDRIVLPAGNGSLLLGLALGLRGVSAAPDPPRRPARRPRRFGGGLRRRPGREGAGGPTAAGIAVANRPGGRR